MLITRLKGHRVGSTRTVFPPSALKLRHVSIKTVTNALFRKARWVLIDFGLSQFSSSTMVALALLFSAAPINRKRNAIRFHHAYSISMAGERSHTPAFVHINCHFDRKQSVVQKLVKYFLERTHAQK